MIFITSKPVEEAVQEIADFWDEVATNPCGEGGCHSCDLAFHRSCDPIVASSLSSGVPLGDFLEEEDTALDIRVSFWEDEEYRELGGEA